jgi:hypothetical protein
VYTGFVKKYTFTICGLIREIPLVHNSKRTLLANVTFLGDIELVQENDLIFLFFTNTRD